MISVEAVRAWGRPEFTGDTAAQAAGAGAEAAWRRAWQGRAAVTAESVTEVVGGVTGPFAVGVSFGDGTVCLAVDRFAIQTLCYRIHAGRLHFAERADELATLPGLPRSALDAQALFDYLYFHAIPSPRTVYRDVFRVPPGHGLLFADGVPRLLRHWQPVFVEPRQADFGALSEEFRRLLQAAVTRQLDGGKAACFLSGGTDSSTVAGMIGLARGTPAATYSIGFEAAGYDEMAYARIAAGRFGTAHHEYYVTPDDLVELIPAVAVSYDQPFGNSSALPAYCCARMAQRDGVTRILAGDGGDELFGGNTRYAKQRVFDGYRHLPAALRDHLVQPLLLRSPAGRLPLLRKGRSYVDQALVPMPDRLQSYNLLERLGVDTVLAPGFLAAIDPGEPAAHQRRVWDEAQGAALLNRMLAYDWRYTLGEIDLPKVCGTTRLARLEVGFPMLDDALVDFSLRLPLHYKLKGLTLRWFFKEALRGFLPDEILTKKKQGFGLPFGVWALQHAGLRRLATESLRSLATRGIVRPGFIAELLDRRLAEHPGYYGEMVWILMMLEQWLQQHRPDHTAG